MRRPNRVTGCVQAVQPSSFFAGHGLNEIDPAKLKLLIPPQRKKKNVALVFRDGEFTLGLRGLNT